MGLDYGAPDPNGERPGPRRIGSRVTVSIRAEVYQRLLGYQRPREPVSRLVDRLIRERDALMSAANPQIVRVALQRDAIEHPEASAPARTDCQEA